MIEIKNVTKKFDGNVILDNVTATIQEGSVYGLIGANGAGKSTLLRLLTGVYKADSGEILLDGEAVYENPKAKEKIAYVSDDPYFLSGASLKRMKEMYKALFPNFSLERFNELSEIFKLNEKVSISTFSKGMKRQASIMLALSTMPKYLFLDETFDGLDPIMRNVVKNLFISEVIDRKATVILTSHSLRELEDTCDQLSLLHKGGIVFEKDVQDLKGDMFKVQIGFSHPFDKTLFDGFDTVTYNQNGSIATFIVKGAQEEVLPRLKALEPVLLEALPLSLEEVFVHEMSALGYSFEDLLGGSK